MDNKPCYPVFELHDSNEIHLLVMRLRYCINGHLEWLDDKKYPNEQLINLIQTGQIEIPSEPFKLNIYMHLPLDIFELVQKVLDVDNANQYFEKDLWKPTSVSSTPCMNQLHSIGYLYWILVSSGFSSRRGISYEEVKGDIWRSLFAERHSRWCKDQCAKIPEIKPF